ncbi:hypothetical protein AKJ09_04902 [Labilithrix luteola]|uniref:Uncharacterized protein n=2 Tax=Labilithrix luteola TaxID=1391654 RepID=A0A0K1PXJ5_9BACT|nr:hypothetical protein AKJ09_04902 [Labilithrix luteola]
MGTLAMLGASGCGFRTQDRTISAADVSEDRTKLTNFMSSPARPGQPTEKTPSAISREALVDEARIVRYGTDGVCVALHTRTHTSLDVPMSQYRIELNGQRVNIDREEMGVSDWQYTGEREKAVVEFVSKDAAGSFRSTETEQKTFRVIERRTQFCGVPAKQGKITLEVSIPQDDGRGPWGANFVWTMDIPSRRVQLVTAPNTMPTSPPATPEQKAAPAELVPADNAGAPTLSL